MGTSQARADERLREVPTRIGKLHQLLTACAAYEHSTLFGALAENDAGSGVSPARHTPLGFATRQEESDDFVERPRRSNCESATACARLHQNNPAPPCASSASARRIANRRCRMISAQD